MGLMWMDTICLESLCVQSVHTQHRYCYLLLVSGTFKASNVACDHDFSSPVHVVAMHP
jgi:hypothetical protein